jgi:hypothetical protein
MKKPVVKIDLAKDCFAQIVGVFPKTYEVKDKDGAPKLDPKTQQPIVSNFVSISLRVDKHQSLVGWTINDATEAPPGFEKGRIVVIRGMEVKPQVDDPRYFKLLPQGVMIPHAVIPVATKTPMGEIVLDEEVELADA